MLKQGRGYRSPTNSELASNGAGEQMSDRSYKPKLLLHVCCGPCATAVIERVVSRFDVVCFWYNPNIEPTAEYERRLAGMRTVAQTVGVPLIEGQRDTEGWREAIAGWENEPEGGQRCPICFEYRLRKAAEYAQVHDMDYLATALTVSPHQDAGLINSLGKRLSQAADVRFMAEIWRKEAGFQRSVQLSEQLNLYRQNYCGCIYSMRSSAVSGGREPGAE